MTSCGPAPADPPPVPARGRPNIVYLFSDQHRGDVLGAAGNPAALTPNLDGFAAESVLFRRNYTNAPLCRPARGAMMSGLYPHQTGLVHNLTEVDPEMPSHVRRMRDEAGYHTMVIGKVHLYDGEKHADNYKSVLNTLGFSDSIELLGQDEQTWRKSQYSDWLTATTPAGERDKYQRYIEYHDAYDWFSPPPDAEPWALATFDHLDQYCARRTIEWLDQWDGDAPFYLQVNFPGPHKPFNATSEFRAKFDLATAPFPEAILVDPVHPSPLVDQLTTIKYEAWDAETVRKLQLSYYATVNLVDDAVGQVLAVLEARGLLDDTWVIYHSDHGEMLGDHRLTGKVVFYEGAMHVPLMIRPPGGITGWQSDALVDTLDVSTSILALAGLGRSSTEPGRSLVPTVERGAEHPDAHTGKSEVVGGDLGYWFLRTDTHKIGYDPVEERVVEMFDLEADPSELTNLYEFPGTAPTRDELMARLQGYLQTYPAVDAR